MVQSRSAGDRGDLGERQADGECRVAGDGLEWAGKYAMYQHVLWRAVWSGLESAANWLGLLLKTFDCGGVLVFGIDESLERRRGQNSAAKGSYRDPVRCSKRHFVKASGLRWISMKWLTTIAFAQRLWALPFLTVLAPSERHYPERGRKPKTSIDGAQPMVFQLRRWLPGRSLVIVADSTSAALEFLDACAHLQALGPVLTRLRLDAAVYEPPPPYAGKGRPRKKGARLPTLQQHSDNPATLWQRMTWPGSEHRPGDLDIASATACWFHFGLPGLPLRYVLIREVLGKFDPPALLSTDVTLTPDQILALFIRRWQMQPTLRHVREHLGVETHRHCSAKAIACTTPFRLGWFSPITLLAKALLTRHNLTVRSTPWSSKTLPTFAQALALVRSRLWAPLTFQMSAHQAHRIKVPRLLLERFQDLVSYAP